MTQVSGEMALGRLDWLPYKQLCIILYEIETHYPVSEKSTLIISEYKLQSALTHLRSNMP